MKEFQEHVLFSGYNTRIVNSELWVRNQKKSVVVAGKAYNLNSLLLTGDWTPEPHTGINNAVYRQK